MAAYWFFKMAAVRHLWFLQVQNFNCLYPSKAQYASPFQILCRSVEPMRGYGRFSIFQDGGRPSSCIWYTPVWTIHEVYFGGLCHCVKFGLNRYSIFDNMQVLIFWALSLKMPIHAHFRDVLGVKIGEVEFFCMQFYPSRKSITRDWHSMNQTA